MGFLALRMFLALNGWRMTADKVDATRMIWPLAAGEVGEDTLTARIERNLAPRP